MQTRVSDPEARADVGVLGGSGFSTFVEPHHAVQVSTPFGEPSGPVLVGQVAGRSVAFLARHGQGHRHAAHRVNYRANLWALRAVGVRQVLAACAVGSLLPECRPGALVVPDQLLDRTWGRPHTVYDEGAVHVSFADPYCAPGRAATLSAAASSGVPARDGGVLVVVNGPRFSTRAEAAWHRDAGGVIVGMTGLPEAAIARELALCYTAVALVTDMDAGTQREESVSHAALLDVLAQSIPRLREVVAAAVHRLPAEPGDDAATCPCRRVLDGLRLPFRLP